MYFQDVQWGDIDYMYHKFIFTRNNDTFYGLPEFVDKLHDEGQKYVIIVVSTTQYKEDNILMIKLTKIIQIAI